MADLFIRRWADKEREKGFDDAASAMVPCGSDFLPYSAAPCLTFNEAAQPVPLLEAFGIPSQWSEGDRERLGAFLMIGSDGAGNPICLERGTGAVALLDHENGFRARQFVNGSVRQLAECLLSYMGEQEPERFRSAVAGIDPAALAEGSFWWHEAAVLGTDTAEVA